jgi:hypothetical protein
MDLAALNLGLSPMKKSLLTIAFVMATLSSQVIAASLTGTALVRWCNGPDFQFCNGYLLGVSSLSTDVCYPSVNVNTQQMRAVVVRYLTARPEEWHREAYELVLEAYRAAWPCNKGR